MLDGTNNLVWPTLKLATESRESKLNILKMLLLIGLIAVWAITVPHAQDATQNTAQNGVHLFILSGQSNMAGLQRWSSLSLVLSMGGHSHASQRKFKQAGHLCVSLDEFDVAGPTTDDRRSTFRPHRLG